MIKIAVRLFNHSEKAHVENVFKGFAKRLENGFSLSSSAEADAIIVSPNDPGFETLLNMKSRAKSPVVVIYDQEKIYPERCFLKKPATSQGLLSLHDDLTRSMANVAASIASLRDTGVEPVFSMPLLISLLKESLFQRKNSLITHKKQTQFVLLLDGINQLAYVQASDLDGNEVNGGLIALLNEQQALQVESLSFREVNQWVNQSSSQAISLEKLLWLLASHELSACRLSTQRTIVLRAWPDFSTLPYNNNFVKLTALLMRQPASISELAKRFGLCEAEVHRFIAACFAINLADFVEETHSPLQMKLPAAKVGSDIIQKIKQRFFGHRVSA